MTLPSGETQRKVPSSRLRLRLSPRSAPASLTSTGGQAAPSGRLPGGLELDAAEDRDGGQSGRSRLGGALRRSSSPPPNTATAVSFVQPGASGRSPKPPKIATFIPATVIAQRGAVARAQGNAPRTNTSALPFVSRRTRFRAYDAKATKRPPAESEGRSLSPFPAT